MYTHGSTHLVCPLVLHYTADKKIRGWEVDLAENCLTLAMEMSGHLEPVRCLALSPDDSYLFSGSEDATIKVRAGFQQGYDAMVAVWLQHVGKHGGGHLMLHEPLMCVWPSSS
jgi:hypothetical protein